MNPEPLYKLSRADRDYFELKEFSHNCADFNLEETTRAYEREFDMMQSISKGPGRLFHLSLLLGDLYTQQAQEQEGDRQKSLYSKAADWYQKGQLILQQTRAFCLERSLERSSEHKPTQSGVFEIVSLAQ